MAAKPLNRAEKAWLAKLQKVLDECPSNRFAGFTIGDPTIVLYDKCFEPQIWDSGKEVPQLVDELGAKIGSLYFPFPVEATRG